MSKHNVIRRGFTSLVAVIMLVPALSAAKPEGDKTKERLDALESDVASLRGETSTNAGDIDTLETNVSTNAGDIDTLESNVSTNVGDIAALNISVAANASNIEELQTATGTNASDIAGLQTTVDLNSDDIATLLEAVDVNTSDIGSLQTALANQLLLNAQLQQRIDVVIRRIRAGNLQQEMDRVRGGMRQRLRRVQEMNEWRLAGLMPSELPATILHGEVTMYEDVVEGIRCSTEGMETDVDDDCVLSTGEVVEEDSIVVSEEVQVVYEEFTIEYEEIIDDAQLTIDQAIVVAIADGVTSCELWDADQDNDVLLAFCLADIGVDTAETFFAVTSAMVLASQTTDVLNDQYITPACLEILGSNECPDYNYNPAAAWEPINIEGEDALDYEEPSCTLVTGWSAVTGTASTSCL